MLNIKQKFYLISKIKKNEMSLKIIIPLGLYSLRVFQRKYSETAESQIIS